MNVPIEFGAKLNITRAITRQRIHLIILLVSFFKSNPYSFPLCSHSTTNIMTMNKFVGHIPGKVKN